MRRSGKTLQEAAASRLPVVAPAAGGLLDLVEDGVTGYLVPPADPDAFAAAVRRLAADPAMRAAFGAAGRRKVLSRSWPARVAGPALAGPSACAGGAGRARMAGRR
jgi:phosphatidylinositol alpha 1,6-mannosyltransferase